MSASTMTPPPVKRQHVESEPRKGFSSEGVFSINFIRSEFLSVRTRRLIIYAAVGYLAFNILWAAGLAGKSAYTYMKVLGLEKQLGKFSSSAPSQRMATSEMETLYERAVQDVGQVNSLANFLKRRFPAAGKLDALGRTLPARIWITEISGSRDSRALTVHATYLVDSGKPYELPTKAWIEALKADPNFGRGLKRLELGNSFQKTQGSAELFSFELLAEWAPETAS